MKNKWPKRAPALLAAVALTASMFPTGALALEAERQDTAETVTAAVQQTPTPTIAVENVETGNTATPETAAEPETQLQEETVEQEESAIQTAETAALQQEPEAETAVQALAAEPDSLGKVWLTEIFPNDFDNRNKNEYGTTDDRFECIELINTADTPVNLTTDYELVYGTKADNTNPFAVQETDGSDVVLQPGEVTVVWNQRTNVKKPGTVEDFRSNYMIPDNVHIVISKYGEDWANTGYFGLRARATGTVCADYSYVNGTIDKNDGKDIADGLGVDLAIPNVGYSMTASTKKTAATPGYVYSEQRGGNTTAPAGTEGLYVTEIYPNDGDRSAVYGVSDDLMEFVEVTNTTDHDIDFNTDYQFQYIYKTQFTRLTVCTVEDAHKEALGEVTRDELDDRSAVIPAHSSAVFWCYRESWLTGLTQPFPDEAAFRAAYNMPEDAPLYCVLGQNGMKNTDRAVGISHAENGRQVLVSSFFYNGLTDTKDKKSVNLSPSAEGPRMTACTLQQAPTPGSVSDAQFNFPADDGSTVKLGMWQDSTVPATITQGDELRVRFSYSVDKGALPRTKITTYYRFDGTGNWNNKTETYRRVPGLYEMNIAANELFDHEYVEFYVAADNRYHRTTTQVYRVNIQKLSSLIDGIRTNITDGQEVRSTVTATANDGGDNANSKILLDGVELPVGKVLENGAYYSFATAGRDSYFHNALTLADDNLTDDSKMEHIASLLKWQNYRLDGFAVPIDSHYFTYDAASDSYKITLRFWAGTYTSSVYDKLMPSANREDFTVTNLQLKLANGKSYLPDSIGPESYTYPDTGKVVDNKAKTNLSTALDAVHNIGDSTGMAPYLDAAFTIPAKDATAVGAVIDTTALTEGAHTLTVTDGTNTKNVSFLVDNTAPVIDLGVHDGETFSGAIRLAPTVTEKNTLGEMVVTLDGEPVSGDIDTNAVTLGAGTHTLAVYARDAAGNEAVKSADFVAGDDVAVILNAAVSDIGQNAASLNVTAEGNMQGAQATYYQLDALNSREITSTTNDGILPYITYTLKVGEVSDSDSLVLSWNGRASNADATHASRLFVQNTATGAWDEAATADENGSMAVRVPVKDHVQDGTATVMVQCTADSALPDFSGVTDQAPAAAWDGTTIPRNYDFAFAWETDTQYYSEEFFQHYLKMNNWIVDNKDKLNIRYVIHTGDIVDDFDMPYEWENADEAMKILDDANMPYGVLAGNHDIAAGAMEYENYQKYFGAQRVQDQPTFGEAYKDNIGHYDLLTENGQDFIILYMSWDIYADEINWMNSVLQKYSDRKAILCFHTYTRVAYNSDGGLMDYYGQLVQDNVVAQNPNVIAVLNGHYHGASYETTVFDDDKDGVYDRTVYQICTDYQSGFEGGSGYIKMLYFDLDNNKIYINSYSPSLDDFNYYDNTSVTELGTESAASVAPDTAADGSALPKRINNNINTDILTLDVNFHTDPQTILTSYFGAYLDRGEEIGTADFTVAQDSSRTGTAALTWDGLQPGTAYAWYAQVTNTLGSIQQTAVQRFTTAAVPADVPPTPGNAPAEPDPGPNTGNATSTGNTGSTSTAAVSQGAAQTAGKGSTPAAATAAIPQTGDTMPIVAVVLLCLGSMTALGILTIYRRKRKED